MHVFTDANSSEIIRNCQAVMEVKTKLTKLLETEFKCTICDEVFVEVSFYLSAYYQSSKRSGPF